MFFDFGTAYLSKVLPAGKDQFALTSVEAGLRFAAAQNLAVRFDYGYRLDDSGLDSESRRFHFSAVLSF